MFIVIAFIQTCLQIVNMMIFMTQKIWHLRKQEGKHAHLGWMHTESSANTLPSPRLCLWSLDLLMALSTNVYGSGHLIYRSTRTQANPCNYTNCPRVITYIIEHLWSYVCFRGPKFGEILDLEAVLQLTSTRLGRAIIKLCNSVENIYISLALPHTVASHSYHCLVHCYANVSVKQTLWRSNARWW